MDDSDDPMIQFERAVRLREELTGKVRAKLADDPEQLAKFDTLYDAARYAYPLTEDHAFYIDQMGVVLFRRFVRAVGAALAHNGVIEQGDDVFFLHKDEVRDALSNGGDLKEHGRPAPRARSMPRHRSRRPTRSARHRRRRSRATSSIPSSTPSSRACSASSRRRRASKTRT